MAISSVKTTLDKKVSEVWEIVTSLENYSWRSDLAEITIISDKQFVECTKDGYTTDFTIVKTDPYKLWEFEMENDNMRGHWVGEFTADGEQTHIQFTEEVSAKKIFMKPFVRMYLKKQQMQYITDLKKALQ